MRMRHILAAGFAVLALAGTAGATTLSGVFSVQAVNATGLSTAASRATMVNFSDALAGFDSSPLTDSTFVTEVFDYTGALNFDTRFVPVAGSFRTIDQFLATAGGTVGPLGALSGLQNSKGSINNSTAITTFYLFTLLANTGAKDFSIVHDDGVLVRGNGVDIGGSAGPNSVLPLPTLVTGFTGGQLQFLYVSTNNDPSVFKVDATVVPLPAGVVLLLSGLGGLALLRRKRAAAA